MRTAELLWDGLHHCYECISGWGRDYTIIACKLESLVPFSQSTINLITTLFRPFRPQLFLSHSGSEFMREIYQSAHFARQSYKINGPSECGCCAPQVAGSIQNSAREAICYALASSSSRVIKLSYLPSSCSSYICYAHSYDCLISVSHNF